MTERFTVLDHLRIITVTDNGDGTYGVTGRAFDENVKVYVAPSIDPVNMTMIDAADVTFVDSSNITFAASGFDPATYNVIVENPNGDTFIENDAVVF
jgi:hypothetical protein